MSKQTIGIGASAGDGTGDSLRAGGAKINANFDELYLGANLASVPDGQAIGWSDASFSRVSASRIGVHSLQLSASGVLYIDSSRFMHSYADPTATGQNTFMGVGAGNFTMSPGGGSPTLSSYITAIGHGAAASITTAFYATAVGAGALGSLTSGPYNVGIGRNAGGSLTTGAANTAIGLNALQSATTPIENVAIGTSAMDACTTGYQNCAVGTNSQSLLTNGYYNTSVGGDSLKKTTTGNRNTALGFNALLENTTGWQNIAIGEGALKVSQTCLYGIAIGAGSMFAHTSGDYSTAVGTSALLVHTTGGSNTCLGATTLHSNLTGSGNVAIGYTAGKYELGSNAFYLNNQDRTNTATEKTASLMYGMFDATPANQRMQFNASVRTMQNMIAARTTAPADADLNDGELCMWWDEANSDVAWKAKNAAGTIRTGTLALT